MQAVRLHELENAFSMAKTLTSNGRGTPVELQTVIYSVNLPFQTDASAQTINYGIYNLKCTNRV